MTFSAEQVAAPVPVQATHFPPTKEKVSLQLRQVFPSMEEWAQLGKATVSTAVQVLPVPEALGL